MLNLLFSPSGRINASDFLKAAIILIIAAAVLSLPQIMGMSPAISSLTTVLGFVVYYCWVAIWIKRYHDGGKSGAMALIPIAVYIVLAMGATVFLMGDGLQQIFQAASEGVQLSTEETEALMQPAMVPILISTSLISLAVAFLFNNMIKQDPTDNKYGPPA